MRTDAELLAAIKNLNDTGRLVHQAFFREDDVARILFLLAEGAAHTSHSQKIEDQHRMLLRLRDKYQEQQEALE